jgi:hypothetical protein
MYLRDAAHVFISLWVRVATAQDSFQSDDPPAWAQGYRGFRPFMLEGGHAIWTHSHAADRVEHRGLARVLAMPG